MKKTTMFAYVNSSLLLTITTLLSNVIILFWIPPHEMGIWLTVTLIHSYLSFIQLGVFSGLNREYPYLIGANLKDQAEYLATTALSYTRIVAYLIIFISGFLYFYIDDEKLQFAALTTGIGFALSFVQQNLSVFLRINLEFKKLSQIQFWQSILNMLSILLVWKFGFEGLCLRFLTNSIISLALTHSIHPINKAKKFHLPSFVYLIKTGIPIMLFGYLYTISNGFSRIITLNQGDLFLVGLLAPALVIYNAMETLPSAINSFISPYLSRNFGSNNNKRTLFSIAFKSTMFTLMVLSFLCLIGWLTMPFIVKFLFPKYLESTYAIQLMMIASVFTAISSGVAIWITTKQWHWAGSYSLLVIGLRWFIPVLVISSSTLSIIEAVSFGLIIANGLIFTAGIIMLYISTNKQ